VEKMTARGENLTFIIRYSLNCREEERNSSLFSISATAVILENTSFPMRETERL